MVPFSKAQLEAAPAYSIQELTKDDGHRLRQESYDYYRVQHDW